MNVYEVKAAWCNLQCKSCVIHSERFRGELLSFSRWGAIKIYIPLPLPLRFACGQYGSFTVFAVSLRFIAFRRIRAEKSNMFNFSASTRGTCGRSRKRAVHLAVSGRTTAENRGLNRISVKGVLRSHYLILSLFNVEFL